MRYQGFIHCLDMGPYEILGTFSKIFMSTICAWNEGQKLIFIKSFIIYTKRVRLLANLKLTRVVISE